MQKSVRCFAHGHPGEWQAICLDLDIAAQGKSFEEVREILKGAIAEYIRVAEQEDEQTRRALLNRRAPFSVRLRCWLRYALSRVRSRSDGEAHAGFEIPCHA